VNLIRGPSVVRLPRVRVTVVRVPVVRVPVGDFDGPHPFFGPDGKLL